MFCKHCGKEIPDDSKVCPYCNAEFEIDSPVQQAEPEMPDPKSEEEQAVPTNQTVPACHDAKSAFKVWRKTNPLMVFSTIFGVIYLFYFLAVFILPFFLTFYMSYGAEQGWSWLPEFFWKLEITQKIGVFLEMLYHASPTTKEIIVFLQAAFFPDILKYYLAIMAGLAIVSNLFTYPATFCFGKWIAKNQLDYNRLLVATPINMRRDSSVKTFALGVATLQRPSTKLFCWLHELFSIFWVVSIFGLYSYMAGEIEKLVGGVEGIVMATLWNVEAFQEALGKILLSGKAICLYIVSVLLFVAVIVMKAITNKRMNQVINTSSASVLNSQND